jgi:hypothetical protein
MRLALALALAIALSAPGAASARGRSGNSKCQWIARQMVNADAMRDRAAELDDKYGVDRYEKRIDYLEDHFEESCPLQAAQQKDAAEWNAMLKTAAKTALTYFTFGAY